MEDGVEAAVARMNATDAGPTMGRDADLPAKQFAARTGARVLLLGLLRFINGS